MPDCRFDLRLKPIQRAKFEALVDDRKRDQAGHSITDTTVDEEVADSKATLLTRQRLEELERERAGLAELV